MITIFIPVYNEEKLILKNICKLRSFLKGTEIEYEFFLGNNGSTDKSLEIIQNLCKREKDVLYNTITKKGPGKVFRKMVMEHDFDKVITVDMDLAVDLAFIKKAAKYLCSDYDMVIGYKQKEQESRKLYRKVLSNINVFIVMYLLGLPYHDYSIGAKAYSYKFLSDKANYIDDQTFYPTVMVSLAQQHGSKVVEIPVGCSDSRKSKFNLLGECCYKTGNITRMFLYRLFDRF